MREGRRDGEGIEPRYLPNAILSLRKSKGRRPSTRRSDWRACSMNSARSQSDATADPSSRCSPAAGARVLDSAEAGCECFRACVHIFFLSFERLGLLNWIGRPLRLTWAGSVRVGWAGAQVAQAKKRLSLSRSAHVFLRESSRKPVLSGPAVECKT